MGRRVKPPASVLGLITDIPKQPEYGDRALTTRTYAFGLPSEWARFLGGVLRRAAGGSVDVERLGSGRLAAGIERDLLDPGFGLAQQLLAAALEVFAALIDGNRFLKRNFPFLKSLHDGF